MVARARPPRTAQPSGAGARRATRFSLFPNGRGSCTPTAAAAQRLHGRPPRHRPRPAPLGHRRAASCDGRDRPRRIVAERESRTACGHSMNRLRHGDDSHGEGAPGGASFRKRILLRRERPRRRHIARHRLPASARQVLLRGGSSPAIVMRTPSHNVMLTSRKAVALTDAVSVAPTKWLRSTRPASACPRDMAATSPYLTKHQHRLVREVATRAVRGMPPGSGLSALGAPAVRLLASSPCAAGEELVRYTPASLVGFPHNFPGPPRENRFTPIFPQLKRPTATCLDTMKGGEASRNRR